MSEQTDVKPVFGLADLSFLWAFAILMAGWLIGSFLARRRYT